MSRREPEAPTGVEPVYRVLQTERIRGDEPELAKETTDRSARAVSAARRVQRPAVGDTLQLVLSTLLERDPGPGHEITNGAGHEHLSGSCESADARGDVHCDSGDPGLALRHLSSVQPASNVEASLVDDISQVHGAANRSSWAVEGCEHTVACGIHELAAIGEQCLPNRVFEAVAVDAPAPIADLARMLRRVRHVHD